MSRLEPGVAPRLAVVVCLLVFGCTKEDAGRGAETKGVPKEAPAPTPPPPPEYKYQNPLEMNQGEVEAAHQKRVLALHASDGGTATSMGTERQSVPVGLKFSEVKAAAKKCSFSETGSGAFVANGLTDVMEPPEWIFPRQKSGGNTFFVGVVTSFGWLGGLSKMNTRYFEAKCPPDQEVTLFVNKQTDEIVLQSRRTIQPSLAEAEALFEAARKKLAETCPRPLADFKTFDVKKDGDRGPPILMSACDDGDLRIVISTDAMGFSHGGAMVVSYVSLGALRTWLASEVEALNKKQKEVVEKATQGL